MYAYKVGYTGEHGEEISEVIFHSRMISEREFNTMCAEAFARGGREEMDKWIREGQAHSISHYMTTVDSMYEPAMKKMVVDFGFDRPNPYHTVILPGLASIVRGDHWVDDGKNASLDRIREATDRYNLHEIPRQIDEDDTYSVGAD